MLMAYLPFAVTRYEFYRRYRQQDIQPRLHPRVQAIQFRWRRDRTHGLPPVRPLRACCFFGLVDSTCTRSGIFHHKRLRSGFDCPRCVG